MKPVSKKAETMAAPTSIAVGGSKGGVGKTSLVANLAIALGRSGRRVLLVDGDLGLANLDVLLGLVPTRTIEHFVRGESSLEELLLPGPAGVLVLPAASGLPRLAQLEGKSRRCLLSALAQTAHVADQILVDTGAGLGETTLSFQLAASRVVLVTTSEPTSLVDTYAALKVLWSADPHKSIDLVVNDVESDAEGEKVHAQLSRASRHFLHREPGLLGVVYRDPAVSEAVRRQHALLDLHPDSRAARCYGRIALRLAMSGVPKTSSSPYWTRLAAEGAQETLQ